MSPITKFSKFIPITKVDEAKRLVYGTATAEEVDKSGEICDYNSTKPYYKAWSNEIEKASGGKSLGNVREMHSNIAAGKLTDIIFDDDAKKIEICAKIVDDSSWEKVLEGVLTGFSQGGEYIKRWADADDKTVMRYTARPSEVSVVDNPCLGSATFELLRANGVSEVRKFKTKEPDMNAKDAAATTTVNDGKPVQPKFTPVQKWEASDGKTFAKKEEWRTYEVELEAKAAAAAPGNDALKALDDLNKAITEKEKKPEAEAEAEGDDPKKVAKAEGDPADADAAKVSEAMPKLKKGMYEVGRCADLLANMDYLCNSLVWEAANEGDNSPLPNKFRQLIVRMTEFLVALVTEEAAELAKPHATELLTFDALAMAAGMPKDTALMMLKFTGKLEPAAEAKEALEKFNAALETASKAEPVAKAGARNSAADKAQLGKAKGYLDDAKDQHEDAAKAHGKVAEAHSALHKCMGSMEQFMGSVGEVIGKQFAMDAEIRKSSDLMKLSMDEMEGHLDKADKHMGKMSKAHDGMSAAHDGIGHALKAVGADSADDADDDDAKKAVAPEMKKLLDDQTALQAKADALTTENADLKKTVDKVTAEVPALIDRIKKLEAQPMPAKGAVFPVEKGHEANDPAKKPVEATPISTYGMSPEEQRRVMLQN